MPETAKVKKLAELKSLLAEQRNFVLANYKGLDVPAQNELRAQVRQKNGILKVIKNNLFQLALKESEAHAQSTQLLENISGDLKGPIKAVFTGTSFQAVSKAVLDYGKKEAGLVVISGCLDGSYLLPGEVKELANLPSREELLSIIGRGINTPASKIALGLKGVMGALARGIQAVGEKIAR